VLVVEGEKTADKAAELFPDHVVTTSPGGAKAAAKADLSPLREKRVAIWGDADAPGRAYAEEFAGLARKAGATKVVVVDVPDYFRKPDGSEGWDLADPPPPGWDLGRLRRLLDEAAFGKDTPVPDFTTILDQAAELDSVSYDRRRDELAEELGIRKSTLDAEVAKRRQERQEEKKLFLG
jgi:DNA primase